MNDDKTDAARYRWLRQQSWDKSCCVVTNPAETVKWGTDCPSHDRLDALIDKEIEKEIQK